VAVVTIIKCVYDWLAQQHLYDEHRLPYSAVAIVWDQYDDGGRWCAKCIYELNASITIINIQFQYK
jgi:hypothetical protein